LDGLLQSWDYLCLSDIQDGGHSRTNMGPYWKMNTSFYLETPYMIEPKLCMQRANQNPQIEEEQTIQWQKKKYKRTNNDLQIIHIKLKIK
jgi:hypothetical protein